MYFFSTYILIFSSIPSPYCSAHDSQTFPDPSPICSHCPGLGFKFFMSQILTLVQKPGSGKKGKIIGGKENGNVED